MVHRAHWRTMAQSAPSHIAPRIVLFRFSLFLSEPSPLPLPPLNLLRQLLLLSICDLVAHSCRSVLADHLATGSSCSADDDDDGDDAAVPPARPSVTTAATTGGYSICSLLPASAASTCIRTLLLKSAATSSSLISSLSDTVHLFLCSLS